MDVSGISGIVSCCAAAGQGVLASVSFNQEVASTRRDQEAEIQAEAIAGPIAVGVESDGVVGAVEGPDIAVVVKREVEIKPGASWEVQNRHSITVAAAAKNMGGVARLMPWIGDVAKAAAVAGREVRSGVRGICGRAWIRSASTEAEGLGRSKRR